jgi:integration host factor subunit beta
VIKSELIERIAERNPHLFQRDVEHIVNAILERSWRRWRAATASSCAASALFREEPAGATGTQPAHGRASYSLRKVRPFFKTGKDMRERLNLGET